MKTTARYGRSSMRGLRNIFAGSTAPGRRFKKILENILDAARIRPLVIQSLWFRMQAHSPPMDEIEAYCDCLNG